MKARSKDMERSNIFIPHVEWRVSNEWYWWRGNKVFTELGHVLRGKCCSCGCRHCPYEPKHSSSKKINKELESMIKTITKM